MNWLTIDDNLPALSLAFDGDAVARRFTQQWPAREAQSHSPTAVKSGRRQDVHYVPATRCVSTYSLSVEEVDAAPWPTIGVIEVTPAGIQHRLFTADAQLRGLAQAADVAAMAEPLRVLGVDRQEAGGAELCAVTPVRYKPGARCTFRYDMRTPRGQTSSFGKLFARGGAHQWQTISTLYAAGRQESELPRIPRPLGYWPEAEMLFQAAVAGAELHTLAFDRQIDPVTRVDWLRAAGRCIAALHSYQGIAAPRRSFAHNLAELDEYLPAVQQANPALAERYLAAIAALQDAGRRPELAPVVSHGALRTDQFLLEDNRLVLIDLDGVCWASPAHDLGNLLAYLDWKALRQPQHAAFIRHAQRAFLAGYRTLRALPDSNWLPLYQAAAMLKIVGRRYSGLTYQEWPLTGRLLDQAVRIVRACGEDEDGNR
jgi:hypothetical protein